MINFEFYTPTKVVFGRGVENEVGKLVKEQNAKKVLLHFGGGSAEKSGLLGKVRHSLEEEGIPYVSLGGVVPNPHLGLVYEGIDLCKKEGVDFLLAVGGGSVIDSAKAIAYGIAGDRDVWDYYDGKAEPTACAPVGAVLTIAAAGSEMSNSSVITNEKTKEKRGIKYEIARCKFAVMNPELTMTLPAYQTAVGVADVLMHTIERYFTPESTMMITDGMAESLLRTVMENGQILTRKPDDYNARAEIMWAGSLSHNNLMGLGGGPGDWAVHQLGHELSGKFGLAHGASLTAVWGSWARYVYKNWVDRFEQFALNVMEVEPGDTPEETALLGIEAMEEFFWAMHLPTSIAEAEITLSDEEIEDLAVRCTFYGRRTIGAIEKLGKDDIAKIYQMAQEAK